VIRSAQWVSGRRAAQITGISSHTIRRICRDFRYPIPHAADPLTISHFVHLPSLQRLLRLMPDRRRVHRSAAQPATRPKRRAPRSPVCKSILSSEVRAALAVALLHDPPRGRGPAWGPRAIQDWVEGRAGVRPHQGSVDYWLRYFPEFRVPAWRLAFCSSSWDRIDAAFPPLSTLSQPAQLRSATICSADR
jgi:hypothetical protein